MSNIVAVIRHIRWLVSKGLAADSISRILNRHSAVTPNGESAWTPEMVLQHLRFA